MKLSFRDIEPFVRKPNPQARVILVYGPDNGLIKERASMMGKTIIADLNDPFNAVTLSAGQIAEDPARLSDEANSISMMGGDRLIRIEDATDKLTTHIKTYLENPSQSTLTIIEAGELSTRSSLRKLCESAKNAAAVPCYIEDERDVSRFIRTELHNQKINIENDALTWLAANIAGDRARVRAELEKLITYKYNDNSPVTIEDVTACCGEAGALALDDLINAVAGNNPERAIKTYNKLNEEGVPFIVILRSIQNHFIRLHSTRAYIDNGLSIEEATKKLSPPLFFKAKPAFQAQLSRWRLNSISRVLERLNTLEAQCKSTGAPIETLCAQTVLAISKMRG